uniref:Plus3 domain-containing protein n=1 Tax=Babesia bovis TaxID=5865 RepID=A7AMM0_BABBO|eukprot:XP_001611372.1 hypothetical protein [Babesia bovis T2Bo]
MDPKCARTAVGSDALRLDPLMPKDDSTMTDFQREMLLAEQHAEILKKRQRERLFNTKGLLKRVNDGSEIPQSSAMDTEDFDTMTNINDDITVKMNRSNRSDTLFTDDARTLEPAPVILVNRARISRIRALHIMDHPNRSKYLVGSILHIFVNPDASPDSISSQYPHLINSHVIFHVERLITSEDYPVYGSTTGNNCDHDIYEYLGKTMYCLLGRVMTEPLSEVLCRVGLNEICSSPITQEQIKFGGANLLRDLNRVAINLRNFTFTDDDVRQILEKRLFKESDDDVTFQGGRSQLITTIQRTSHEIELLTEIVKNDASKVEKLRALEARKEKLEQHLSSMKTPVRNRLFIKNCPILRAKNEPSARGGAIRKVTQPTPMILCELWMFCINRRSVNHPTPQELVMNEQRNLEPKGIADLSFKQQEELVVAYLEVSCCYGYYNDHIARRSC